MVPQSRMAPCLRSRAAMRLCGLLFCALLLGGCRSPEDGRLRGGGPGADGGNYREKPVHAPSKLDGTKPVLDPDQARETRRSSAK
jgi:hypothetical protein